MIGKIKKGSGFKGCVNYVLGKEQAVLLHADGVLTESRGDIIHSFCMQTGMNPDLKKPVGHIALSYSAVDAPKLTDGKMVQLAQEYMREMKITDTQYIIVRHQDRQHREALENGFGKQVVQGYSNVIAALKQGYASIGYERGRNVLVSLNKFLVNKRMIVKEGKGYRYNPDFHY